MRVGNLVAGRDPRPDGSEGFESFTHRTAGTDAGSGRVGTARGHVKHHRVAKNVIESVVFGDVSRLLANDDT